MCNLTGFQRDLLSALDGLEEPHGLALKNELENTYRTEVHHGQLSPNLEALVDEELVEKRENDRHSNSYTLTGRGRRELQADQERRNQYGDEDADA